MASLRGIAESLLWASPILVTVGLFNRHSDSDALRDTSCEGGYLDGWQLYRTSSLEAVR